MWLACYSGDSLQTTCFCCYHQVSLTVLQDQIWLLNLNCSFSTPFGFSCLYVCPIHVIGFTCLILANTGWHYISSFLETQYLTINVCRGWHILLLPDTCNIHICISIVIILWLSGFILSGMTPIALLLRGIVHEVRTLSMACIVRFGLPLVQTPQMASRGRYFCFFVFSFYFLPPPLFFVYGL